MTSLKAAVIEKAFQQANLAPLPVAAYSQMAAYLELLERWNGRLNLTSLRSSEAILRRHFLECAFALQNLPADTSSLMDYGSGAGFPGMVIAICRPEIRVTLAEAHAKKAAFLREVARTLGLPVEIYPARVEEMPANRRFDAVSLRAVEKMEQAIGVAIPHAEHYLVLMTTKRMLLTYAELFPELSFDTDLLLPGTDQMTLSIAVPRGTTR